MAKEQRRDQPHGSNTARPFPGRPWWWLMGLAIVGMGALLWAPWRQSERVPPGVMIAAAQSTPAFPFTLPSDTGDQVRLSHYLGKQPVVLVFYMGDF